MYPQLKSMFGAKERKRKIFTYFQRKKLRAVTHLTFSVFSVVVLFREITFMSSILSDIGYLMRIIPTKCLTQIPRYTSFITKTHESV